MIRQFGITDFFNRISRKLSYTNIRYPPNTIARPLVEDHLLQTPPRNDYSKIHQLAAQAVPRSGGQACIHQLLADPGVGSLLSLLHRSVFLGLLLQSEYLSV